MLGVGAFGKVFMGLNLDTGELIAVKQISLEGQHRREAEAVEHEVNLLRNLRHDSTYCSRNQHHVDARLCLMIDVDGYPSTSPCVECVVTALSLYTAAFVVQRIVCALRSH